MNYQPDFSSTDEELAEFDDDYDFQEFLREEKRKKRRNFAAGLTEEQKKEQRSKTFYSSLINGRLDEVVRELEKGFDVNQKLQNDWTPILIAASTGNFSLVQELNRFGADVKATRDSKTTLMLACNCPQTTVSYEESSNVVKFLLDKGVNPNALNRKRMNALMYAANTGNLKAVKHLVPVTDLKSEDNQGWNALFWAVESGKVEIVEYLLNEGLEFEKTDVRGNTPLDIARNNDYEEIEKLFSTEDDIEDCGGLVNHLSYFGDIFKDLKGDQKPQFFVDVSKILYGTRCENLIKQFAQNEVNLFDLLYSNEALLKKMGVQMPFQRKRLIAGIHRFHKHLFHPKSLPIVGKNEVYSNVDVAAAILSSVKQLICMEASLKYIENNVNSDSTFKHNEEIRRNLDNIHYKISRFKQISSKLNKKVQKWDLEIAEPNVIHSTSGRRWFPWRQAAFTVGMMLGVKKPFDKITRLDIEDVHSLGQSPITFLRQILASVSCPSLLGNKTFPEDVKLRARKILDKIPGNSVGSYSDACGIEAIRRQVAKYIHARDNVASDWKNCIIGQGANDLLMKFLNMIRDDNSKIRPSVLYPVPGNPSHFKILKERGIEKIGYHLTMGDFDWEIATEKLEKAIEESREKSNPRAIIVINPGNPTGTVLTKTNMERIIKFAFKENLIIIADETYQNSVLRSENIFHSFKKISNELGEPYKRTELVSLACTSDCIFGESGLKSGFAEFSNFDTEIYPFLTKQISSNLCPSTLGQIALYAMVNPPQEHEISYELYNNEINTIRANLKMSANIMKEALNQLEGIVCTRTQGSMYVFPHIDLPELAIKRGKDMGVLPDQYYAIEILNNTGICVSPGCNYGQLSGTYHVRLSALPEPDTVHKVMQHFKQGHVKFLKYLKIR